MNTQTLIALQESIAHWKRMRRKRELGRDGETPGISSCSLCVLFRTDRGCSKNCPVKQKTGWGSCYRTPYILANRLFWKAIVDHTPANMKAWRKAADAEIAFLESFLPTGSSPKLPEREIMMPKPKMTSGMLCTDKSRGGYPITFFGNPYLDERGIWKEGDFRAWGRSHWRRDYSIKPPKPGKCFECSAEL